MNAQDAASSVDRSLSTTTSMNHQHAAVRVRSRIPHRHFRWTGVVLDRLYLFRRDAVDVEQRIETELARPIRRHGVRWLESLSIVEDEHVVEVHLGVAADRG